MLGTVGLASFLIGALGLTYLAGLWFVSRWGIPGLGARRSAAVAPWSSISLALLLFGGQLLSIGILGELIMAYHERRIPTYSVCGRTKPKQPTQNDAR